MTAASFGEDLDRLLDLAARSFLAYVAGGATLSVSDDSDRTMFGLLQELAAKEQHYVQRAHELVLDSGRRPSARPFSFNTSYYNFVRPKTLAERLLIECDHEVAALRALEARFGGGEELEGRARRLAADFIALRTEERRRVVAMLQSLYPPPPPPAPVPAPAAKPVVAPKPAATT